MEAPHSGRLVPGIVILGIAAVAVAAFFFYFYPTESKTAVFDDVSPAEAYEFTGTTYHLTDAPVTNAAGVHTTSVSDTAFEAASLAFAKAQKATYSEHEDGTFELAFSEKFQTPKSAAVGLPSEWELRVETGTSTVSLGAGRSPRLNHEAVVALAPEGLISIHTKTWERSLLVSHGWADRAGSALSSDGTRAALTDFDRGALDFYAITNPASGTVEYLGSIDIKGFPVGSRTAFLGDNEIVVLGSSDTASVYGVPEAEGSTVIESVRSYTLQNRK